VPFRASNHSEFLAIQEDTRLRVKKLVEQAGTGFAFPSCTVYLGRDGEPDMECLQAAAKPMREWASEQALTFPDFAEDYRKSITDTLDYSPEESPGADGECIFCQSMRSFSGIRIPTIAADDGAREASAIEA